VIYTWWELDALGWLGVSVRTARDIEAISVDLRETLRRVDPAVPIQKITSATAIAEEHLRRERLMATLASVFGAVAIAVAAVGLYGVLALFVARRTREIGIRVALGARRARVLNLVVRQSAALAGAGLVCGIPLAVLSGQAIVSQLYGVEPADPSVLAFAAAVIAGSAGLASVIPALRALRVDPVQALRHD
jgi:ABC-type lipoprotein release transport system permease subunit